MARAKSDCQPCIICGRQVRDPRYMVHVHDGGDSIVTEVEASMLSESADMGLFPIGPDCLKAHPEIKPYVQEQNKKSRLDWQALYFDLYRQVNGEQAPESEIMADAQKRASIVSK